MCQITKPLTEYGKGKDKHGVQSYCKPCQQERVMQVYYRRKEEAREPDAEKECVKCKQVLPAEAFFRAPMNPSGLTSRCRKCRMRQTIAKKRGLTEDELDAMEQACWICRTTKDLVVDHCHDTGAVRGTLCRRCNTGIGMFGDDMALIERAVQYLKAV